MAQFTTTRPLTRPKRARRLWVRSDEASTSISALAILTCWQLRQTWHLLCALGVGLLAAVVLVCAMPLYAQVAEAAGLRHTLEADPQNMYITVHTTNALFSTDALHSVEQTITQEMQSNLGSEISAVPDLSMQISTLDIAQNRYVRLVGTDASQAERHLTLTSGRLPAPADNHVVEFALSASGLAKLHLQPGAYLHVPYNLLNSSNQQVARSLTLHFVGVFTENAHSALFWHGETFSPETFSRGGQASQRVPVLVDNTALTNALVALSAPVIRQNNGGQFTNTCDTYWYYRFDISRLDINHLAATTDALSNVLASLERNPVALPYVVDTSASGPLAIFQDYRDRVTVLGLPILCLALLTGGLVLLLVVLFSRLFIQRQLATLTLLRSRGASEFQLANLLLWQGAGIGLFALISAPLLVPILVQILASRTLLPADQSALTLITAHRWNLALSLAGPALLMVGLGLLSMALASWRILASASRRMRPTTQTSWTRFRFDLVTVVLALVGFLLISSLSSPGVIDVQTRVLLLPFTTLFELLCLLLAGLLLCLRFWPRLLRLGVDTARYPRGLAPLLALTHMAGSSRQTLRAILFLALPIAFALFTLIFAQTQSQRLRDLTAYRVGGDISGEIPATQQSLSWNQLMTFYTNLNGIDAVTLGYTQQTTGGSGAGVTIDLRALDASTYARTVYWTSEDGTQSITDLTRELIARRAEAGRKNVLPAIIDETAARSLGLTVGQQFVLRDFHGPLSYQVMAIVHFIPTIYDSISNAGADTSLSHGGVLVDYQTYSVLALAINQETISPTNVWLRTSDSHLALLNARHTLLTGTYALDNPADRRQLDVILSSDPLYAALRSMLVLGAGIALLFGLSSALAISWVSMRQRRGTLALLRASGSRPRQMASILLWEQGIIYGSGLVSGVLLGFLGAWLLLPAFIFSPLAGIDSADAGAEAFYLVQSVPAVHEIIPTWPIVLLLGSLLIFSALALVALTSLALRSRARQALLVNEHQAQYIDQSI